MFIKCVLLFLSFTSTTIIAVAQSTSQVSLEHSTYTEAAYLFVPEAFHQMIEPLKEINKKTQPHNVKTPMDVRKIVLRSRDMLDLFAFAMPNDKIKGKDGFLVLRDDLDRGYAVLGAFKDLFDAQGVSADKAKYKNDDVKKRLKDVLEWRDKFLENKNKYQFYLQGILTQRLEYRPRDQLSQFYWGISEQTPNLNNTAAQVFRILLLDLLQNALLEWPEVRQIKDPTENIHNIEAFHDFRKRMRTVLKITNYFPELMSLNIEEQKFLSELSSQYGVISDQVSKIEIGIENNISKKKLNGIEKETKELWDQLQDWEDERQLEQKIKKMINQLMIVSAVEK